MNSGIPLQMLFDLVRTLISDDAKMYTDTFLLSAVNSSIHILAVEEDLQRLFKYRYQTELATVYESHASDGKPIIGGRPAARWTLDVPGEIVGNEHFNIVEMECYKDVTPCYQRPKDFFGCYRFPEQAEPGLPCHYTLENYNGKTTLIVDRPFDRLVALDAMFYIIPEYITKDKVKEATDKYGDYYIPMSQAYAEVLAEMVKVFINEEQTDMSTANARLQNYDKLVVDIANKLALQEMGDAPVFVNGFNDTGVYR